MVFIVMGLSFVRPATRGAFIFKVIAANRATEGNLHLFVFLFFSPVRVAISIQS
jgi:hypothetical protein